MTPSVSQSSGGRLRRELCSVRPIPSFPCSSSMSRSCELLLFTMIGPILRRNTPSLYIGCTFEVSLVRRITDLSWKVDDIRTCWKLGSCHSPVQTNPCCRRSTSKTGPRRQASIKNLKNRQPENTFMKILWSGWKSTSQHPIQLSSSPLQGILMPGHAE